VGVDGDLARTSDKPAVRRGRPRLRSIGLLSAVVAVAYLAGIGTGWAVRQPPRSPEVSASPVAQATAVPSSSPTTHPALAQVDPGLITPQAGVTLPVAFGSLGPRLVESGAIDLEAFEKLYADAGRPLTPEQMGLLTDGSDQPIVITKDNAQFLLNVLWATGLANENPILTGGRMMAQGKKGVVNFASTGGWTLASKPIAELYAGAPLVALTDKQQARLEEVTAAVYRPCCDNPTAFPDCNHGMAMLGLLEMMAAGDASSSDMFSAARTVNAFWFPQQTMDLAVALKATQDVDFDASDARPFVGQMASGSGSRIVAQWLAQRGGSGGSGGSGSCGVQ
jgi:hypothetical protein